MKNIDLVKFKNDIGQEITPGDPVVIVTTGYSHNVNTYYGQYLGMNSNCWAVCLQQKNNGGKWCDKDTLEPRENEYNSLIKEREMRLRAAKGLPNSLTLCTSIRHEYDVLFEKKFVYVPTKRWRKTTLQRNRIYKLAPTS